LRFEREGRTTLIKTADDDQNTTPWEDMVFTEPEPPPDYVPAPISFDDADAPPQLVRTVKMSWQPNQGSHKSPMSAALWSPAATCPETST
jgi:hypothetical protein